MTQQRSNHDYVFTGSADIARGYAVNGLNQYTQVGGVAQGHDANGNLVSDGATTFGYDAENRLISASGAKVATLAYDPLGRLWRVAGASSDTRVLGACPGRRPGDGDQLAAEYDAAGTLLRRYAWGPDVDEPVLWDEGGALNCSGARLLMGDHQGSVIGLATCAGARLSVNRYDEWGTPDAINAGRFQYTGQAWLPELGLYHYKARLYSPFLGRFLQVDPVGYDDQINLYAYVGNDPVNSVDVNGQESGSISYHSTMSLAKAHQENRPINEQAVLQQILGAVIDFVENYQNMRDENRIGADKEFHCRANCEASTRGELGEEAARQISRAREDTDDARKGSNPEDRKADEAANKQGQDAGREARQSRSEPIKPSEAAGICKASCASLSPAREDDQ